MMMFYILLATLDEEERSLAESIYLTHRLRMYTVAVSILLNHHDAEEAVEDATIKIIKYIDEFKDVPGNKVEALVVLYSRCSAIDYLRKRERLPILTIDDEETPDIEDTDNLVDETIVNKDLIERIRKCVEGLRTPYREVMLYKYFYEKDTVEIAELLNMKEGAVRTALSRARDMVQKQIRREKNE